MAIGLGYSPSATTTPLRGTQTGMMMQTSTPGHQQHHHQQLSSPSSSFYGQGSSSMIQSQTVAQQQQGWESSAAAMIAAYISKDENFAQYHELLKCLPGSPSISGLMDGDYPNLESVASTMKSVSQISNQTTIPLPTGLVEQFGHMQSNCEMGIFTEIRRCWLTIDSNIFLWNYDNSSDVAYYDGLTETILGVGLIKPKKGIFKDYIKYLLVLTTSVGIVILGVTFTEDDIPGTLSGSIRPTDIVINDLLLIPEAMFSVPTDNVVMNVVSGSSNGRIFLGAKTGHIYEVVYNSNESSWIFTSKCYKINHSSSALSVLIPSFLSMASVDPIVQIEIDDGRHILYTRSESGTIEVFDLGHDGNSMSSVASKSLASLVSSASVIARTIDSCHFKPIVSINVIEASESSVITLMAVTESGVRLFFATNSYSDSYPREGQRPNSLMLVHIRLPPGFSSSSSGIGKPSRVHLASYKRGATLFVSIQNEDADNLWLLNNDIFAFYPDLLEVSSVVNLNSRVWKMVEEQRPHLIKQLVHRNLVSSPSSTPSSVQLEPPLLVTQDMEEMRKFVLLSTNGVHIIYKPRPVDHLKQLLMDNQGIDNEAVKGFFQLFGDLQASVACLSLACNTISPVDKQVAEWSTLAFFKYSSDVSPLASSLSMAHQQQQQTMGQTFAGSPIQRPFMGQTPFLASSPIQSPQPSTSFGLGSPMVTSPMSSPMQNVATSPFVQTMAGSASFIGGGSPLDPINDFSVRHNSLYQYFSRIVRPFWNFGVIITSVSEIDGQTSESVTSSVPIVELVLYIQKLGNLKEFMNKNLQLSTSSNTSRMAPNLTNFDPNSLIGVQLRERNSLNSLITIINCCLEVLNLWKILLDHQFHTISNILGANNIQTLKTMAFKDVILSSTGHDICSSLASALIQKYIEDNSTTDAISKRLVDSCPSIFKTENALTAKAHEKIMKAKNLSSSMSSGQQLTSSSTKDQIMNERKQLIDESFVLLKKIGGERINLQQAVELLLSVNCVDYIIDLVLKTAADRDPQSIGINFYKLNPNGTNIFMNNPDNIHNLNHDYHRGLNMYNLRMDCYNILMAAYEKIIAKADGNLHPCPGKSSPSTLTTTVPRTSSTGHNVDGHHQNFENFWMKNFEDLSIEESEILSINFIKYFTIKSSNDELSHVYLYDWLFHHKNHEILLSIKSPFLEEYLKRKTESVSNSLSPDTDYDPIKLMDLLWMFYERNGHYRAAAEILSKLAEKSGSNINLYQRMEYLARAIVCLKSGFSSGNNLIPSSNLGSVKSLGSTSGGQSSGSGSSGTKSTGELLHEMEEKMDVAKVQLQILDCMNNLRSRSANTTNFDLMIQKLNNDLLDITSCYEIAESFKLPELQLRIVVTANHYDPGLIESFWRSILGNLLNECINKSSESIKVVIENKLVNLGSIYLPSDKYFPLDFIISYLESKSKELKLQPFWLPTILMDGLNLSITHLLTVYHKLYKSKGPNCSWTGKEVQLLSILCQLISKFANSPQLVARNERRSLVTKCLDVISGYLLDLQTIPTADGRKLMQEFKLIQTQLNNFN